VRSDVTEPICSTSVVPPCSSTVMSETLNAFCYQYLLF
jgi:hypothetical protein